MAESVPDYNIITGRRNNSFPKRSDTMYLGKITNQPKRQTSTRKTNRLDDIAKAQPRRFSEMYTHNMPDLHNVDDIPGARPGVLHAALNKPSLGYTNADIPGSQAKPYTFKTSRCVDPNDPSYTLASVEVKPPTPPRFLRDQIDVSDIDGATPGVSRNFAPRDNMTTMDIPGAQAGWIPRHKRRTGPPRNNIDYSDVMKEGFRTQRRTNPLDPVHSIHGVIIKDTAKQHPRPLPPNIGQDFNLTTGDVEGAYPEWKAPHHIDGGFKERGRKEFRVINRTDDIHGATADSKHNYIFTKRVTNPLQPSYVGLDGYPYDQSPPCTPAYDINNPPKVVKEKMEQQLAKRSEKDEMQRTKLLNDSVNEGRLDPRDQIVPKLQVAPKGLGLPPQVPKNNNSEDKDAEIQRLRQEIEQMKMTMSGMYQQQQNSGRRSSRGHSSRGNSGRGLNGSRGGSRSSSSLQQAGGRISSSRKGEVEINSESSQRLVLKSRDGRPRVPLTPSQMKMAQKKQERMSARRQDDINAVKDLY
eukprot:g806.t1